MSVCNKLCPYGESEMLQVDTASSNYKDHIGGDNELPVGAVIHRQINEQAIVLVMEGPR